MQDRSSSENHEVGRFSGIKTDIARSCGTGEPHDHYRDPVTADLRRAKKAFEGDRPVGHVSPYEIDMDDRRGDEAE